jgi:hypothetical protein
MLCNRRDFLLSLGAAGLVLSRRSSVPVPTLRIAIAGAAGADADAARRGALLGVDEARRAGALFGLEVALVPVESDTPPHAIVATFGEVAAVTRVAERARQDSAVVLNACCAADELRGARCDRRLLHVAASEAMQRDALALAPGEGVHVELWHDSLEPFGAAQLNDRFRARWRAGMNGAAWGGWFAVKVASEAFFRSRATSGDALLAAMIAPAARFDGHKGRPLSFRAWDHQLRQPLYVVRGPSAGSEVTEVPSRAPAGVSAAKQLDRLGTRAADSRCRWAAR